MNKIVILDPSCIRDSRSHHMNALIGHARSFLAEGHEVIAGTNRNCTQELSGIVNSPVFDYSIYDDVQHNTMRLHKRFLKKPVYYVKVIHSCEAIKKIFRIHDIGSDDYVFVPTLDWILLRSLSRVYKKPEKLPRLHLLVMYERANWITGGYPYERMIRNLLDFDKNRVFIYTETRKHAAHLALKLGYVPPNYPYPAFPFARSCSPKSGGGKYIIGALGGGRRDKGYALLPGIIGRFNDTCLLHDKVTFHVQRARNEDRLDAQTRILENMKNVVMLDNQISRDDYEKHLLECDINLFPYDSRVYSIRGSGIVNEALANGIPIICTKDTALAESIICNNGKTADSIDDFSQAIIDIIDNIDIYRNNAKQAAEIFLDRLYNNPVIKNIRLSNPESEAS